jgi:hypothetical protein
MFLNFFTWEYGFHDLSHKKMVTFGLRVALDHNGLH